MQMSSSIYRVLSLSGAACLILTSVAWSVWHDGPFAIQGQVHGADERPLANLSVFLDRGENVIERFETDSAGAFRFPLWVRTPHRATWLICPVSANPIVGVPEYDEFSRVGQTLHRYQATAGRDSVYGFYRQRGWSGPIPRECPPSRDVRGWRYPASAGREWGAYATSEPDWRRYPGPPALPPSQKEK